MKDMELFENAKMDDRSNESRIGNVKLKMKIFHRMLKNLSSCSRHLKFLQRV